jgi:hypothetical protein
MRAKLVCLVVFALLPGACSRSTSGTQPPAPLDKSLLPGKWKNSSDSQLVSGYEFDADGVLRVAIRGMEHPLLGRYSWEGDRDLNLEYQTLPEVQQAYEAAAKAYKDDVLKQIKDGKLPDRAGPSIIGAVRNSWPEKETVKVAISDKPRLLILGSEGGVSQTFELKE